MSEIKWTVTANCNKTAKDCPFLFIDFYICAFICIAESFVMMLLTQRKLVRNNAEFQTGDDIQWNDRILIIQAFEGSSSERDNLLWNFLYSEPATVEGLSNLYHS